MTDYRAVMDLVLKGWSVRQIRTTVGCSHTTVQKAREALEASGITTEAQLAGLSSESLAGLFHVGRSTGQGDFVPIDYDAVAKARTGRHKVTLQALWGRYTATPAADGQQNYGQPMGAPQWGGQPNPQQPQWGGQPGQPQQQWGQPDGQQPWNQGAPAVPTAPRAPRNLPEWPTWVYAFQLLITFIASFLSVANARSGVDGIGSVGFSLNWWGRFDLQSSGYGKYADNFLTDEIFEMVNEEANTGFMVFATLLILVLYGVAIYFCMVKNWKLAWILGIAAGAIQFLAIIIAAAQTEEGISLGAGWWLWLLISLVTLALSVALLVMGKDKLDAQVNKARASAAANQGQNGAAGAPVNQAPFNPAAPQQSSNSWQQPNQQNAGGWNQQPSGSGSTSWNQSSQQENGSNDWARRKASYDTDGSSGSADPEKNQ